MKLNWLRIWKKTSASYFNLLKYAAITVRFYSVAFCTHGLPFLWCSGDLTMHAKC